MRVLHWYPNFLGGGGVANAVLGLAQGQARAGAEVRIAAAVADGTPLYGKTAGTESLLLTWLPAWQRSVGPLALRGLPRSLRRDIVRFAPDVVHAHGEFNPDNYWALNVGGRNAVVVLSPHGAFDPRVLTKTKRLMKRSYVAAARLCVYRRLSSFHALSPREQAQIRLIAPGVSTYVVPQGGGPTAAAVTETHANESPVVRLVFVGRLDVYTKGLDLVVIALANILRDSPQSIHFTLVGPDWRGGRTRVEQLASDLGIADALSFTGALPSDGVARVLDSSDCVILASRHEGFSLSATEALLRGKPLILSRETGNGSYAEIASQPHVLITAPDAEGIESALKSFSASREILLGHAKERQSELAEFLSWDRAATRHLDVYEELARSAT